MAKKSERHATLCADTWPCAMAAAGKPLLSCFVSPFVLFFCACSYSRVAKVRAWVLLADASGQTPRPQAQLCMLSTYQLWTGVWTGDAGSPSLFQWPFGLLFQMKMYFFFVAPAQLLASILVLLVLVLCGQVSVPVEVICFRNSFSQRFEG